jgi:hypothetical protein
MVIEIKAYINIKKMKKGVLIEKDFINIVG